MKKTLLAFVGVAFAMFTCLLLANLAFAIDEYDVRQVRWGMTKIEVKKSENRNTIKEDNDRLAYQEQILGNKCVIIYNFSPISNKLMQVMYLFYPESEQNSNTLFSTLSNILMNKYGDDENNKIKQGMLKNIYSFVRKYKNEKTQITLMNSFQNEKILIMEYIEIGEADNREAIQREKTDKEIKERKEKRDMEIKQF